MDDAVATLTDGKATAETPPRPKIDEAVRKRTAQWWEDTNAVPHFDAAVVTSAESQKTLYPHLHDVKDPWRGKVPKEMRKRKDDRRVNVMLAYKATQQTVAMTVPDDHSFRWRAKRQVQDPTSFKPLGKDPVLTRFAQSIEILTEARLDENDWMTTYEAWVQDACQFPIAVLKVSYQREYLSDSIGNTRQPDQQDQVARLKMMLDRFNRGQIKKGDAEYKDLQDLKQELDDQVEIDYVFGIEVENLDMSKFRFSPLCRSLERIYDAPWMSFDVLYTIDEAEAKFPWRQNPDGTFSGIHPDDWAKAYRYDPNGMARDNGRNVGVVPKVRQNSQRANDELGNTKRSNRNDLVLVREIECKTDRRVRVLVEGIEYPALEYVPKRRPQQWYSYVILVLNRKFGEVYGIADVELVRDLQERMNRKWSDDEQLRSNALWRGVYNTSDLDEKEAVKLSDIPPGHIKGINTGGTLLKDAIMPFFAPYDGALTNTQQDEMNFQRMASQPPSFNGVTGDAKFSSEVQSAMQGLQVAASFRQRRVRRASERFYTMVAEILLQEERADAVLKETGPAGFWPDLLDDKEAKAALARITAQAKQDVGMQFAQQVVQAQGNPDALAAVQRQWDDATTARVQQVCKAEYGFPEPPCREALFRRLRCKVKVGVNGPMEKQERSKNLLNIFTAMGEAAAGCAAAGIKFNAKPFVRMVAEWMDEDDNLDEMFEPDPNMLVGQLQEAMQSDPSALQPPAAQALVQMAQVIAAAMKQVAAEQAAQQQQPAQGGAQPQQGQPAPAGAV